MKLKKRILCIMFTLALGGTAVGQTIRPPQPNYNRYGSYNRQMRVYTNAVRQQSYLEREKYRKFREEIRRQTNYGNTYVIGRSRGSVRIIVRSNGSINLRGQGRYRRTTITGTYGFRAQRVYSCR